MICKNVAKLSLLLLPLSIVCSNAFAQNESPVPARASEAEGLLAEPVPGNAAAVDAVDAVTGASSAGDEAAVAIEPAIAQEQTVLRAQVLLDRAHFSAGEIDGRTGSNFKTALAGFQRNRGLDDDGSLGPMTWAELERDPAPTLVDYTVLAADVEGPFEKLPQDMIERSKLPALGYASIAEAFGERFHASPKLLDSLNKGKQLDVVGETIQVPNVLDAPAPSAVTQVIVDRSDKTLLLADADGKVIAQFPSSTGSEHDPLPVGDWKVNTIALKPAFYYNPDLFWDADPTHSKAKLPPGPNNPVGMVWIDLSKEHYGIHGTSEPSRVGKTESHGCIRVTNWTAMLLSESVKAGMPVVLRE